MVDHWAAFFDVGEEGWSIMPSDDSKPGDAVHGVDDASRCFVI
ncbi:hypothetical protein [Burkholderia sp. Bp8992]|nr:hypothetical protein [Burkholderia sp. Bp8992]